MIELFNEKMKTIGYDQFVCDIFPDWEEVKDELLVPDRKYGSGNGTIHVFLGAADAVLRKEFASYYEEVEKGEDPALHAVKINHFFLPSNVLSMVGYLCKYEIHKNRPFKDEVAQTIDWLDNKPKVGDMLSTYSLFKLSTGSSRLRPYFKQFESDGVFTKLIRKILLPKSSYKISLYKNSNGEYAACWLIGFKWQDNFEANSSSEELDAYKTFKCSDDSLPRQVIYYGAPGTGKSHEIKKLTKGKKVIRTTFHPDSDYSTFVGAYKPTMEDALDRGKVGRYTDGDIEVREPKIVYTFVEQAFLQAYINAWELYARAEEGEKPVPQFLIIEEINRGNCAQIFGDLFQLLDRNDEGFSEYPITADRDMKRQLSKVFSELNLKDKEALDKMFDEDGIADKIKNGEILVLPSNLYIWATMNTSDQSLFPIDSAFKRRWDWKYVPISEGVDKETGSKLQWKIKVNGTCYDWWSFLQKINAEIDGLTSSQDKKLGFFFCKAKDGVINAETFTDKVLFFLWNEVLKDFEKEQYFLKNLDDYLSFDDFYSIDDQGNTAIQEDNVEKLLNNLGVALADDDIVPDDVDDPSTLPAGKIEQYWQAYNASYGNSGRYKKIFTNPKGNNGGWLYVGGLKRNYKICFIARTQKKVARVQLVFPHGEPKFKSFLDNEEEMKKALGCEVSHKETSKMSYFQIEMPFDIKNDEWDKAFQWYHKKAVIFYDLCNEIDPK